jgi:hypothetical protein
MATEAIVLGYERLAAAGSIATSTLAKRVGAGVWALTGAICVTVGAHTQGSVRAPTWLRSFVRANSTTESAAPGARGARRVAQPSIRNERATASSSNSLSDSSVPPIASRYSLSSFFASSSIARAGSVEPSSRSAW